MADATAWYQNNTMVIELGALTDEIAGTAVTTATVTAQLEHPNGNTVTGETWPVTLSHVSAGTYRGVASYAITAELGQRYHVEIVATVGTYRATWRVPVLCQNREE